MGGIEQLAETVATDMEQRLRGIADQRPPWCDTRPSGCLYITRQIAGRHVIALARDNDLRTDLQSPRGPSEGGQTKANREKSRTCADPHWTAPLSNKTLICGAIWKGRSPWAGF